MVDQLKTIENLTLALSGNADLVRQVSTSVLDPVAYIIEHKQELDLRGISTPVDNLPWVALVDGMLKDGDIKEFDWKEGREPIVRGVMQILQHRVNDDRIAAALQDILPALPDHTPTLFRRLAALIRKHGHVLMNVDLGGDSYAVTTVELDLWPSVKLLADEIDHGRIRDMQE